MLKPDYEFMIKNRYSGDLDIGDKVFIWNDEDLGTQEAKVIDYDYETDEVYIDIPGYDSHWCVERDGDGYWGGDCEDGYLCLQSMFKPNFKQLILER